MNRNSPESGPNGGDPNDLPRRQRGPDTLHSQLIDAYIAQRPGTTRRGSLATELKRLFRNRREPSWGAASIGFVPDAYRIDHEQELVVLVEVVVTSVITADKWEAIAELFLRLDEQFATENGGPWRLYLDQVDRHGVVTEFNLATWAFFRLCEPDESKWPPYPDVAQTWSLPRKRAA